MKQIFIHSEYIKLDQFLKLSDCVSTGGMAKARLRKERFWSTTRRKSGADANWFPATSSR